MIRFVFLGLLVLVVWFAGLSVWRWAAKREIDWTGVAFAVGFVALAFWLRGLTGMG
ncbi:MAG: hypothetical protein INR68_05045 [Methylobacterium mesophilicum]|nr:hypothetical protein [Methylobacterium mesophilicum]